MEALLAVLSRLSVLPPDQLPIFLIPDSAPPSTYARIIDPPTNDPAMSTKSRQAAADVQSAGMWNTLGLMRILVEACTMAEGEQQNERIADIGRQATVLLSKATELVPDLVLIALEKLPVS